VADALPTYPKIFRKVIGGDPAITLKWESLFQMPSDVQHWKMYLVTEDGLPINPPPAPPGAVPAAIQVAYEAEPGDQWWPLFYGAEEDWRHNRPAQVFVRPFANLGTKFIVVAEVWLSKMPAQTKDKEKSELGPVGKRQE
jgi:hypothetical protein